MGKKPAAAQLAADPNKGKPATRALQSDIAIDQLVGLLTQFQDPDTVLQEAGLTRKDLRRLESDDEISGALETRLSACHTTPWRLSPGEGAVTEFIHKQLEAHMETLVNAAWGATPYGYSVQEIIYARDGARICWDRIEERPIEWFRPLTNGELRYFPSTGAGGVDGVIVDTVYKFFLTRRRPKYRNPLGEALLSRLYWPWFFRTNGWKFWARFLERFGAPLLVGKTEGSTQDMATALASAVQSAATAIGKDDELEAISPGNAGDSFQRFSSAVDRRIQKVVLGQTLTTDTDGKGSYAAAKVHNDVREDRKQADLRMITRTIQRQIDALTALNFPNAEAPMFTMEEEIGIQAERASRDASLATAGIVKFTPDYLLRAYDFEDGDFTIPSEAPAVRPAAKASAQFASRPARFTKAQQALEDLADDTLESAGSPIPVKDIQAAVLAATGPEDLEERLAKLYDDADPAEFREVLERALFAADLMGYADAETEA
jgi:phage gp29-like protein